VGAAIHHAVETNNGICVRCRAPTNIQPCATCQQLEIAREQTRLLEEQNRSIERQKYSSDFDYQVAEWTPWIILAFALIFGFLGIKLFGLKETFGRILVLVSIIMGGYVGYKLRVPVVMLGMLAYAFILFGIVIFILLALLGR
jgi:hypothetical protein